MSPLTRNWVGYSCFFGDGSVLIFLLVGFAIVSFSIISASSLRSQSGAKITVFKTTWLYKWEALARCLLPPTVKLSIDPESANSWSSSSNSAASSYSSKLESPITHLPSVTPLSFLLCSWIVYFLAAAVFAFYFWGRFDSTSESYRLLELSSKYFWVRAALRLVRVIGLRPGLLSSSLIGTAEFSYAAIFVLLIGAR